MKDNGLNGQLVLKYVNQVLKNVFLIVVITHQIALKIKQLVETIQIAQVYTFV